MAVSFSTTCFVTEPRRCNKVGKWVESGYGMVGMCLSDYRVAVAEGGGWRDRWWYRYGAEDLDMAKQLHHRLIIHRPRVDGLIYNLDSHSRNTNTAYYAAKNLWPQELPAIPSSFRVTDPHVVAKVNALANALVTTAATEAAAAAVGSADRWPSAGVRSVAAADTALGRQRPVSTSLPDHEGFLKFKSDEVWRTMLPQINRAVFSLWTEADDALVMVVLTLAER
jgi:hypothetical protein